MRNNFDVTRPPMDPLTGRPFTSVEGRYLQWIRIILSYRGPRLNYVHANTFLLDDQVVLKEYAATSEGIIQSWANRRV